MCSAFGFVTACGSPALPTAYETEHLRIGTDLGHPLCAGDLVVYEEIIRRTEAELGVSMKEKFSVSIWSDQEWAAVGGQLCGPKTEGCTSYRDGAIYTTLAAVEHELVHATISIAKLTPFFSEGLADVYSGQSQTRFGFSPPS